MSTAVHHQATSDLRIRLGPLALGLLGVALLAVDLTPPRCHPLTLATLAGATLVLARLPIRLSGEVLPIPITSLALVPTWLLCGGPTAAMVALIGSVVPAVTHGPARLTLGWQAAASLLGIGLGSMFGAAASAGGSTGLLAEVARATAFTFGLWVGQGAAEWFSPDRRLAVPSWLVCCLTNLVLLPPAVFLAQIGADGDPLVFAASLALAVVLLFLIRISTTSEARAAEVTAQMVSSASAREHLELIVDQAPEALLGVDSDGSIRWLNRTAADWLGEAAAEAVGRPADQVLPVRASSGESLDHVDLLARAAQEGRPLHEEGHFAGAPGAPERVLVSYSATDDPTGLEPGLVLLRDASVVTESLREQEELAVHLSHELRAPLTTILGYAQLMADPSKLTMVPNAQAEFAKRISESGDYMLRLVNNLLDLGRLARTDDDLPLADVDATALTREVVEAHRPQASAKAQELRLEAPPASIILTSSDLALRQILTNLVANAIKYTPPDGTVRVVLINELDAVSWQVIDTGIGLSPEEQEKLFTRFFRSARPEARLIKGTGLGLALTKALVERLGGAIEVCSAIDQGSTFSVRLPRGAKHEPA